MEKRKEKPRDLGFVPLAPARFFRHAIVRARQSARPPMPSISLHAMTDADLQAIYAYITSLGPAGAKEPSYVPPSGEVTTPYFDFVPKNLPAH